MTEHIICMNDWMKAVVLDDEEKANKELDRLAKEYYMENKGTLKNYNRIKTYEAFRKYAYWHLHSVEVIS